MKKILLTTNVLTAMALIVTLCTACPPKPVPSEISNTCKPCKMSSADSYKRLPAPYIIDLMANYRNQQWNWISSNPSFPTTASSMRDSRSVWFSLDKLKDFIANIESSVESNTTEGCVGNHCDRKLGIRIYFGTYGSSHYPPTSMYYGKHTLVMIPTYQNANQFGTPSENLDFDPKYMDAFGILGSPVDTASITALIPTLDLDGMNHGTIIPPPDMACTGARFMHWVDNNIPSGVSGTIPFVTGCPF